MAPEPLNAESLRSLLGEIYSLWRASVDLLEFYRSLKNQLDGRDVGELIEHEGLKRILLGGLREDLSPEENSLSHFYELIYGVKYDRLELASRVKGGARLEEAAAGIRAYVKAEDLLSRVHTVKNLSEEILRMQKLTDYKGKLEYQPKSSIEDGLEGLRVLEELLKAALDLSPNYNGKTLSIVSLRRLPAFYAKSVHPWVLESRDFLRSHLGWVKHFVPNVPQESLRSKYTVMGYEAGGMGERIVDLVVEAWRLVEWFSERQEELSPFYLRIQSEAAKYVQRALDALESVGYEFDPPARGVLFGRFIGYTGRYPEQFFFALKASKALRNRMGAWSGPHRGQCYGFSCEVRGLTCNGTSLVDWLEYLAPQLYLAIATVEKERGRLSFIYYGR